MSEAQFSMTNKLRINIFIIFSVLLLSGCVDTKEIMRESENQIMEHHIKNVTQLTIDGDNGEAYFSWDSLQLIYQSNRNGYACDKIWIMNIDGSDKHMVSPNHGAHTCSFFFPENKKIVFASTSHLPGDCPQKPKALPSLKGIGHVWPLYPYDIFVADADGSNLKKITYNPEYDAEPVVSSDGRKIVFGSKRDGDFETYIMD